MLNMTQLIGFGASAGAAPFTTLSFRSSATSTASTLTAPGDIQAGDLLVWWDSGVAGFSAPASVVPTGFTEIQNVSVVSAAGARGILAYKIADGTEAGATLSGITSSPAKILAVFKGDGPISTATVQSTNGQATTGNPSAQSVAASGHTPPLVVIGAYGASATLDPRTFSPAEDAEISANTFHYLKYKIYNSSPADHSIDMDDEGTNVLCSCDIEVA